jgi:hypothetical protein
MSTLPNTRLSSTTYDVEIVKIRRPVRAKGTAAEGVVKALSPDRRIGRPWRVLKRLDWRQKTAVVLRYKHGDDPRVEVTARGYTTSYPWDTAILDILRDITNR